MSTGWSLSISVVLLVLNAFFVAAEFALVASKRHRLEQAAATGSRSARSAIAGVRELSVMLAGAQLGITLCTLGLGALAKPTVAHLLEPAFESLGLPDEAAYVVAFILAVAVVGFLHVVVGEMAPKSWAITHPEDSALLLARPFRWFTTITRPALAVMNGLANGLLRLVKVEPQDELAQAHGPNELGLLLEASREHGTLARPEHQLLTAMLAVQHTTVADVMTAAGHIIGIDETATARDIELASRTAGRSRLTVNSGQRIIGIVHLRDAVRATTASRSTTAADLMTEPFTVAADTSVATALRTMQEHRAHLAPVTGTDGEIVGLVALEDLLEEIIGEFDDETDPVTGGRRGRPDLAP